MPKVEHKTVINQPAKVIFAVLVDLAQLPKRVPSVSDVEAISTGALAVGSQYMLTSKTRRKEVKIINEVFDLVENRSIGFRSISGTQPYEELFQLAEVDEGTEVTLSASGKMAGLMKLFSGSFKRLLKKQVQNDLDRLENLFEEE